MKIKLIRNATLSLHYADHHFLIDPCFADQFGIPSFGGKSKNPIVELPLPREKIVAEVDSLLISHLHADHFDITAQEFLDKSLPLLCQKEDENRIKQMGFLDVRPLEDHYITDDIRIQRIKGQHGEGEVLNEMGPASGFLFTAKGEPDLFWAGDTILFKGLRYWLQEKQPEIVVTHSAGAVWGEGVKILMDEVQTTEICNLLPESIIIATHMDSVDHATVSRKQLREYADEHGISRNQLIIPEDGDELIY